jgi:NitT/TauT family transport system permease protein
MTALVGTPSRIQIETGAFRTRVVPVLTVVLAILVIWYVAAVWLNTQFQRELFATAGTDYSFLDLVNATLNQQRPVLPSPHQVVIEFWTATFLTAPTSPRSLVYHAWVTFSATAAGFVMGTSLGIALAAGIVHERTLEKSLMPWIVASQTIPILAVAPAILIVGYNLLTGMGLSQDISRFVAKALISTYLSFFPVAVGMVKGLRSPEPIHLDLMRTYSANRFQVFEKLRWPAAIPFLFTSMKVGVAASLIGAIVGELPTGASAGLGARLLSGSYYGQTAQIWAALLMASILAAALIALVALAERITVKAMGARP